MYRNAEKFREMHICRDILMTFMTLIMIFMIHCNIIFGELNYRSANGGGILRKDANKKKNKKRFTNPN